MTEFSIIYRGETIVLRRFVDADADYLWTSTGDSESKRLTGTHGSFTREQIDRYVANQQSYDPAERAAFVIATPHDLTRAIGEVVINEVDDDNKCANIRIAIFNSADFNKGYGTQALRLMVGHGFSQMGLHRIELGVYAFNPRAIRVYEKIGFVQEGISRDALLWDGEYVDEIRMSILKPDWDAKTPRDTIQTMMKAEAYDTLAPDGSEIRFLTQTRNASMVHCLLPAGQATQAVRHRTVDEVWYVVSGRGQIWRAYDGTEQVTDLQAGISINLPLGTCFQFKAADDSALAIIITTIPPWPGEDEALPVENHWPPTVTG